MRVCDRIQNYIRDTGLKQKVVAKKAGYSEKTFSAILTGRRKIYVEDLEKICIALGVSPDKFIVVLNIEQKGA